MELGGKHNKALALAKDCASIPTSPPQVASTADSTPYTPSSSPFSTS